MQNVNDKLFCTAAYLFVDYIFLKIKQKPSFPYKSCKNQTQTTPSHTHTNQQNETKRNYAQNFDTIFSTKLYKIPTNSTQMYDTPSQTHKTPQAKNMNVFYKCFLLIYVKKYDTKKNYNTVLVNVMNSEEKRERKNIQTKRQHRI